jgi:hypothetical protein
MMVRDRCAHAARIRVPRRFRTLGEGRLSGRPATIWVLHLDAR